MDFIFKGDRIIGCGGRPSLIFYGFILTLKKKNIPIEMGMEKSIQKMSDMRYKHYLKSNEGGVAIGEVLMIIITAIMAVILLKAFT